MRRTDRFYFGEWQVVGIGTDHNPDVASLIRATLFLLGSIFHPRRFLNEIAKKHEAATAEGRRAPEYIKSSPRDAPVIAFMPGAECYFAVSSAA